MGDDGPVPLDRAVETDASRRHDPLMRGEQVTHDNFSSPAKPALYVQQTIDVFVRTYRSIFNRDTAFAAKDTLTGLTNAKLSPGAWRRKLLLQTSLSFIVLSLPVSVAHAQQAANSIELPQLNVSAVGEHKGLCGPAKIPCEKCTAWSAWHPADPENTAIRDRHPGGPPG